MNIFKLVSVALCGILACIGGVKSAAAAEHKTAGLKDTAFLPQKAGELVPVAAEDGLYGYMTPQGTWAIPPRFVAANPFTDDGGAWVYVRHGYGRIDTRGEWIVQPEITQIGYMGVNWLIVAQIKGKWGFIDPKGKWAIAPEFDYAYTFASNGLARAKDKEKWGFINNKGEWVISPRFAEILASKGPTRILRGVPTGSV